MALVEKLVLLPRLTEVRALIGFTRFESKGTDIDGDLDIGAEVARIDDPMTWLPAVENSGEGIFFSLNEAALSASGRKDAAVRERDEMFKSGFRVWQGQRDDRKKAKDDFATARYVLLHSLAHLLITAISLECGYAASAIRERIYAGAGGSGVLLYTAAPGAEGSLGGLVEVGRRLERYLDHALDLGRLCSNDPVCAAHLPDHEPGSSDRHLEGASCHGCLLISEPSCERMNVYLDRTLVVPTVENSAAAFFTAELSMFDDWLDDATANDLEALADAVLDGRISAAPSSGSLQLAGFGGGAAALLAPPTRHRPEGASRVDMLRRLWRTRAPGRRSLCLGRAARVERSERGRRRHPRHEGRARRSVRARRA